MLQRYSLGRLAIFRMRWRNLGLLGIYGVPESQVTRVYKGVPEAEAWPDTAKLPPQTLPSDFRGLVSLGFGKCDHVLPKPTEENPICFDFESIMEILVIMCEQEWMNSLKKN